MNSPLLIQIGLTGKINYTKKRCIKIKVYLKTLLFEQPGRRTHIVYVINCYEIKNSMFNMPLVVKYFHVRNSLFIIHDFVFF